MIISMGLISFKINQYDNVIYLFVIQSSPVQSQGVSILACL